jgi:hypothetical protein
MENNKIYFKLRFNTMYNETNLFWRIIIDDTETLVKSLAINVPTFSESSFDFSANAQKWHIAGYCNSINVDENLHATII